MGEGELLVYIEMGNGNRERSKRVDRERFFVFWVGLGEGKRERGEGLEGKKGEREGGEDFLRWEVGKGLRGWECGVRFGEGKEKNDL